MFHRSQRLFLRPPFPEDRDAILRVLGDVVRTEAVLQGRCGCHFALLLPGQDGAPLIGAASFAQGVDGMEICVRIDKDFSGEGYGAEAARALSEIAVALGYGALPYRGAAPASAGFNASEDTLLHRLAGTAAETEKPPRQAA